MLKTPKASVTYIDSKEPNLTGEITGLSPSKGYYYRVVADNGVGDPVKSAIRPFHHPPIVTELLPDPIAADSATLKGKVNPVGSATSYHFEYGLTTAYGNRVPQDAEAVGDGYDDVQVTQPIPGLMPKTTYHYRLVAKSALFPTPVTAEGTFTTIAANPTVVTLGPTKATETSAQLNGTVNPRGSAVSWFFKYGATASYGKTTGAIPLDAGHDAVEVSRTVNDLPERQTYHYCLFAKYADGTEFHGVDVEAFSGAPEEVTPRSLGADRRALSLVAPEGVAFDFHWRLYGGTSWLEDGNTLQGLLPGEYLVEFKAQAGQPLLPARPVTVVAGSGTQVEIVQQPAGTAGANGSLVVSIDYEEPVPGALGQWRFSGESETQWRDAALAPLSLGPGLYIIEFSPVTGRAPVANRSVRIASGRTSHVHATYVIETEVVGEHPALVSSAQTTGASPYQFAGQLQNSSGSGSGTVVRPRVVLTAAHLIFDDETLSYATGLQWRFQRRSGEIEPPPQAPRGSYLFAGYAAGRRAEVVSHSAGHATQASQQKDVAAVFFRQDAGRGGYIGVLQSNATNNLIDQSQGRESILLGYPTDLRILGDASNAGKLYATPSLNAQFSKVAPADDLANFVFASTAIAGYPGMSGGALCVRYDDNNYYPAGVYLGGDGKAVVRAIDGQAMDLIDQAHQSSDDDSNHTNAGTVIVEHRTDVGSYTKANVKVTILPAEARASGAKWSYSRRTGSASVTDDTKRDSGTAVDLDAGTYSINFTPVPGYGAPVAYALNLGGDEDIALVAQYADQNAPVITTTVLPGGIANVPYPKTAIKANHAPTGFSATNLPPGLEINTKTGLLSGTPAQAGSWRARFTAENSVGQSSRDIAIAIREMGELTVHFSASQGTVAPWKDGEIRKFGQGTGVTLTAAAKPGLIFEKWTFSGLEGQSLQPGNPKLVFLMPPSAEVWARFKPNPFIAVAGNYRGLLGNGQTGLKNLGLAQFTVTSAGTFTGSLTVAGVVSPLTGKFASDGSASVILKGAVGLEPKLALQIALSGTPGIKGTLKYPDRELSLSAWPKPKTATAAKYTIELPPPGGAGAGIPKGSSVAVLAVAKTGLAQAQYILADGTKGVAAGHLVTNGTDTRWALYSGLYGNKGVLAGDLLFAATPPAGSADLSGDARWLRNSSKPAFFDTTFELTSQAKGYLYIAPKTGQPVLPGLAGTVTVTTDGPDAFPDAEVKLSPLGVFTNPSAGNRKLQLTLTPATGLFTGSFLDETGKKRQAVTGILEQAPGKGAGFYLGPTGGGAITLDVP